MGAAMDSPCSLDQYDFDEQRYKDCCHLEGETPIEIRIAGRQAPRPEGPTSQRSNPGRKAGGNVFVPEAEKPPMPRGVSSSRLPPPVMSDPPHKSMDPDGFHGDDFVVPPDSVIGHPGLQNPAALRVLQSMSGHERAHYPEIVRARIPGGHSEVEDLCKVPM